MTDETSVMVTGRVELAVSGLGAEGVAGLGESSRVDNFARSF